MHLGGDVGDYFALMKPRVMALAVFTAFVGLVIAPGSMHPVIAAAALLCIAAGAGASGALNMWYDADIDAQMRRTAARPIPRGRILPGEALAFGLVLATGSVICLALLVNWVAAGLLGLAIAYYVLIYTMWLKRLTPQNIVIGGGAGAFPPLIGWAAATGTVSFDAMVLFLIVFLWTPPHFWALALIRTDDYEQAGIPMLPVVSGGDETRRQILLYSIAMVPVALLPVLMGFAGALYGVVTLASGLYFLRLAYRVYKVREGDGAREAARQLFSFSILYLFLLFAALLMDHGLATAFLLQA
jgi:protoheme IX farnesyltransferase